MERQCSSIRDGRPEITPDRRAFLRKLTVIAGAVGACSTPDQTDRSRIEARNVPPGDPRLVTEYITYPGATGEVRASMARPTGEMKLPGVIVIHENRGLTPNIEEVARRVALQGYLAISPDALSPLGGTPEDADEARSLLQKLDTPRTIQNFVAAVQYLRTHPQSAGKVACMGFCWGGGMTNQVAVNAPDLTAAVPFYGPPPATEDVSKIESDMLIHYAGNDQRINAGIPEFEAALKKAGVEYRIYIYEGAEHAFFNDTNTSRYDPEAAQLAWKRTVEFLREKLKT